MLQIKKNKKPESDWVIIITNLCPLYGVFFGGWSGFDLVWLYWLETLIIGLLQPLYLIWLCSDSKDIKRKKIREDLTAALCVCGFFALVIIAMQVGVQKQTLSLSGAESPLTFLLLLGVLIIQPLAEFITALSKKQCLPVDELPERLGPRIFTLFGASVIGLLLGGFMVAGIIIAKIGIEVAMNRGVLSFGHPEYPDTFEEWQAQLTEKDKDQLSRWFPGGMEQAEAYMKKQIERQQKKRARS